MQEIYLPALQRAQSSSASLRVHDSEFSRELSVLSGRLSGSNANLKEPISATGLPSKSKNLVSSGKSANGDLVMVTTSNTEGIPQGKGEVQLARKQTETPEFKKWFGDSKVVDENGEPLVVYRGDITPIDVFKGSAFFGHRVVANQFADPEYMFGDSKLNEGEAPTVTPVYINIRNPKVFTTDEEYDDYVMDGGTFSDTDWEAQGYDGIIYAPDGDMHDESAYFKTFHPSQIKSAIGNTGAFDPANNDIRFARRTQPTDHEAFMPALNKAAKALETASETQRRVLITQPLPVSKTPEALRLVKVLRKNEYVVGTVSTIYLKGTNSHSTSFHNAEVPADVLAHLPELMADPLAIYDKGAFDKTNPKASSQESIYLVVLPVKAGGEYVTVAIAPESRFGKATVNFIKSVHTRSAKTLNMYSKHMVYDGISGRNEKDLEMMLGTIPRVSKSGVPLASGTDITIRQVKVVSKPCSCLGAHLEC